MARRRDKLKKLTVGWAGRTMATGRMAASLGKAAASQVARGRTDGEGLGQALLDELDEMKGLAMKVGQMVSYLDTSMPEDSQRVLRQLQRGSQPMAFEALRPVLEASLGRSVDEVFDTFDPEPVAAASIGQVHRAVLGGKPVAVKVRYPGVDQTFRVDLGNFGRAGRLATLGTALDVKALVRELEDRLAEECDYEREAAVQQLFHGLYDHDPATIVPPVHAAACGPAVLTTGWVDGQGFYDFLEMADEHARRRVAERIFRFSFTNIFHHALLHGDPHPGNLLFPGDAEVAFLDYGCVRFFDRDHIETWKRLAWCILEDRRDDLRDVTRDTGFAPDLDRYDWDAHWEVMEYLYEPFKKPGFRYTHDYVQRSYELMSPKNPNWRRTAMPPAWLLTNRLQWGLNSLLAMLDVPADFPTFYRECLSLPIEPAALPEAP